MSRHDFQVGGRKEVSQEGYVWYIQVTSCMMAPALFLFFGSLVSQTF